MKSNARLFRPGDVLYGRLRPYLNKVYRPNFEGLCSAEFIVFPESPGVDNRYLQYFLNSWSFKRFASHLNTGDRPRVDWDQLKEYGFPLPPHSEQHRIVAAIEEQFSRLDAGVSALERVQTNLKRYRTSVLKAAVEGRLTAAWREEHPDVEPASELLERILKERRERWEKDRLAAFEKNGKRPPKNWRSKYKEPTGPNTEDLPDLPEGWTQATVAQVARSVKYGSSAKTSNDPSGVPVLRMGNIQNGTLDLENLKYLPTNHPEFPDLLLQDGDLLFNRTNSAELVGKSAVYRNNPSPCSYASYLIGARLIEGCVPEHVGYYLNSFHGRSWIASVVSQQVGQAKVNGTKLQALTFPLPPLFEQEAIVKEAKRRLSVLDEVEAEVEANLKRAARLRQAILKRAFEGKLVPQDPTDEPASELLARIRAEREQSAPAKRPAQGSTREPQPSLFPGTNT
jgi:type I restriction enzyme S subunit